LLLVAGRPHALPRIGRGASGRKPLHRGLIFRIDLLGIELELFLPVLGRGPDRNAGGAARGRARLAVGGGGGEGPRCVRGDGSHADAPVVPSIRAGGYRVPTILAGQSAQNVTLELLRADADSTPQAEGGFADFRVATFV